MFEQVLVQISQSLKQAFAKKSSRENLRSRGSVKGTPYASIYQDLLDNSLFPTLRYHFVDTFSLIQPDLAPVAQIKVHKDTDDQV